MIIGQQDFKGVDMTSKLYKKYIELNNKKKLTKRQKHLYLYLDMLFEKVFK
jgi:hypothetical protein